MFYIIIAVILLDQLTKYAVFSNMELNQSLPVIEGFFHISYIHNYGAAFSILRNQISFLVIITGAAIAAMLVYLIRNKSRLHSMLVVSFALVIGGGTGNLIDRVFRGFVVDFLDFRIWPVFNVADIAVVCGCSLLAFYVLIWEPRLLRKEAVKNTGENEEK